MSDSLLRRCETPGRYEMGVTRMRVKAMTEQERPIQCRYGHVLAAMALLLALLIPVSASAGARVSAEAIAQWETQWENYGSGRDTAYEKNADEALLDAFSGDEFDGAVVESYAIEAYHAREGAAVLRLTDGMLCAYALALDDAGIWHIAERTGDLASAEGVDNARVSYWSCMTVTLYGAGQPKCGLEFREKKGELPFPWKIRESLCQRASGTIFSKNFTGEITMAIKMVPDLVLWWRSILWTGMMGKSGSPVMKSTKRAFMWTFQRRNYRRSSQIETRHFVCFMIFYN